MGTVAAAAILHKEREIVTALRAAGATSTQTGKTPGALGVHDGVALRRLRKRAVLRDATVGGLYLDEPAWEALRLLRRRLAFALLGLVIAAGLVTFLAFPKV